MPRIQQRTQIALQGKYREMKKSRMRKAHNPWNNARFRQRLEQVLANNISTTRNVFHSYQRNDKRPYISPNEARAYVEASGSTQAKTTGTMPSNGSLSTSDLPARRSPLMSRHEARALVAPRASDCTHAGGHDDFSLLASNIHKHLNVEEWRLRLSLYHGRDSRRNR